MHDYAVKIRRHLHENPEATSLEFNTIKLIAQELENMGIEYVNIKDGGILGFIKGEKPGKTVLLRADCDALTMQEHGENAKGQKVCVSKVDGIAHTCGHDSHVAMLLSAAKILNEKRNEFEGCVILLFERGEEGGSNIYYVMKYFEQHGIQADSAYAVHSDIRLQTGQLGVSLGPDNAGNVNFEISITGKGGHGSRPDQSNNPIDCFIAIANAMKDIRVKYTDPNDMLTYTIGSVQSGSKRNIIPQSLKFMGTARFFDRALGLAFKNRLEKIVELNCKLYDCTPVYDVFTGPSIPSVNYVPCAELALKLCDEACGEGTTTVLAPGLGSESFSVTCSYFPGVMVKVGMGNVEGGITFGAHHPSHDLDENGMPYGIASYVAYAVGFLKADIDVKGFKPYDGDMDALQKSINRPVPKRYDG